MNFTSQYYQISPWFWENSNKREGKMVRETEWEEEFEELWKKENGYRFASDELLCGGVL